MFSLFSLLYLLCLQHARMLSRLCRKVKPQTSSVSVAHELSVPDFDDLICKLLFH